MQLVYRLLLPLAWSWPLAAGTPATSSTASTIAMAVRLISLGSATTTVSLRRSLGDNTTKRRKEEKLKQEGAGNVSGLGARRVGHRRSQRVKQRNPKCKVRLGMSPGACHHANAAITGQLDLGTAPRRAASTLMLFLFTPQSFLSTAASSLVPPTHGKCSPCCHCAFTRDRRCNNKRAWQRAHLQIKQPWSLGRKKRCTSGGVGEELRTADWRGFFPAAHCLCGKLEQRLGAVHAVKGDGRERKNKRGLAWLRQGVLCRSSDSSNASMHFDTSSSSRSANGTASPCRRALSFLLQQQSCESY